jgi:hypothetical protein
MMASLRVMYVPGGELLAQGRLEDLVRLERVEGGREGGRNLDLGRVGVAIAGAVRIVLL